VRALREAASGLVAPLERHAYGVESSV